MSSAIQFKKPANYHTYGKHTHSEIAKKLKISTSLSAKVENDIFLKFALCLFQPPWVCKHNLLRQLRDNNGNPVKFHSVGEYFENLAELVVQSDDEFKREYERRVVEISKSIHFRKFVYSLLKEE